MSSILRALKKLENEPRHQEESTPLENKFVPSADTCTQRPDSSLFFMIVGGGIACGLVILAGWWLFSEKAQTPPAVSPSAPQINSRPGTTPVPSESIEEQVQAVKEKKSIETPEIQKSTEQPGTTKPAGFKIPAIQIIPQESVPPIEEHMPDETFPAREVSNQIENKQATQHAATPPVVSDEPGEVQTKTVEVEIPRLNDPDIKLQAVTWSKVPQNRIAIINNRILREGDFVSGYLVNTINQDDVVLSREGEKWKLAFH